MKPADEAVAEVLAEVEIRSPEIPVVSNVDAQTHSDPEEIRELLIRQVISPVRWEDSIQRMLAAGCDDFYEVGPGKVLRGLLKRISRKSNCATINDSTEE
jgi:[acyl-carrier-protein] S-malonyltransferase